MTDAELAAKLRRWKPPFHDTAGVSFLALAANRIEALAAENKVLRKSLHRWGGIVGRETVAMAKEYDALSAERDAAVGLLHDLLARIFRDGGHRRAELGGDTAAVAEADRLVALAYAAAEDAWRSDERVKELEAGIDSAAGQLRSAHWGPLEVVVPRVLDDLTALLAGEGGGR